MKHPVGQAILAAILFGAATPASKWLLSGLSTFQLAGLLYLGAAIGVAPAAWLAGGIRLPGQADRVNRFRLLGAVVAGGICGPLLFLFGLRSAAASSVSLWLNFELAATALLGVLLFRDHLGRLGWAGVVSALVGSTVLSLPDGLSGLTAGIFVMLACLCWGLDNHLTGLIDGITPSQSTFWKGVVAGVTNVLLGFALDAPPTSPLPILAGLFVGVWAYGASIVLYISAAQALGATRAQIAFASAPFFGVVLSVWLLGESLSWIHVISALLFIAGLYLLTLDRHDHLHEHKAIVHEHAHRHDDGHHNHEHPGQLPSLWHTHRHAHETLVHSHPHWPDLHHRHKHSEYNTPA